MKHLTLGEQAFKSLSLEDLVKSFDHTINACFAEPVEDVVQTAEPSTVTTAAATSASTDLVSSSK